MMFDHRAVVLACLRPSLQYNTDGPNDLSGVLVKACVVMAVPLPVAAADDTQHTALQTASPDQLGQTTEEEAGMQAGAQHGAANVPAGETAPAGSEELPAAIPRLAHAEAGSDGWVAVDRPLEGEGAQQPEESEAPTEPQILQEHACEHRAASAAAAAPAAAAAGEAVPPAAADNAATAPLPAATTPAAVPGSGGTCVAQRDRSFQQASGQPIDPFAPVAAKAQTSAAEPAPPATPPRTTQQAPATVGSPTAPQPRAPLVLYGSSVSATQALKSPPPPPPPPQPRPGPLLRGQWQQPICERLNALDNAAQGSDADKPPQRSTSVHATQSAPARPGAAARAAVSSQVPQRSTPAPMADRGTIQQCLQPCVQQRAPNRAHQNQPPPAGHDKGPASRVGSGRNEAGGNKAQSNRVLAAAVGTHIPEQ